MRKIMRVDRSQRNVIEGGAGGRGACKRCGGRRLKTANSRLWCQSCGPDLHYYTETQAEESNLDLKRDFYEQQGNVCARVMKLNSTSLFDASVMLLHPLLREMSASFSS